MIEVEGAYEVDVYPDSFELTFGVRSEGHQNVIETQKEVNQKVNALMERFKLEGMETNQIETVSYTVQPIYDYVDGKSVLRTFAVEHLMKITVDNVGRIGGIIDVAVSSGANVINGIQYSVKNKEQYYGQALINAIAVATQKAQLIATSLGVSLNLIPINIVEQSAGSIQPRMFMASNQGTSISPGMLKVNAYVRAVYSIY